MSEPGPIVPTVLNSQLSAELQSEVDFFLKWGYLVIDEALTEEQLDILRITLDETHEKVDKEKQSPDEVRSDSHFIGELLEQDERFGFLIDHPPVIERIKAILGNCVQLHSATSRVTKPGATDQNWHRDGPWPVDPRGTPYGSLPGQINCGYFLDELTMENGPIVIVPGSQRALFRPPEGHPTFPDQKFVLAKPRQAVFFDGWLYHRGSANNSQQERRVCLMCYQNAWMKSREPFNGPRVTKLREEGSPERKLLLGSIGSW